MKKLYLLIISFYIIVVICIGCISIYQHRTPPPSKPKRVFLGTITIDSFAVDVNHDVNFGLGSDMVSCNIKNHNLVADSPYRVEIIKMKGIRFYKEIKGKYQVIGFIYIPATPVINNLKIQ